MGGEKFIWLKADVVWNRSEFFWGKIWESRVGLLEVFPTLLHTIYGHFWLPPAGHEVAAIFDPQLGFAMSYFRLWNSSVGRCKISQFDYYLGRDLHIFFAFETKFGGKCSFPFALLLVCVVEFHSAEVPKALSSN